MQALKSLVVGLTILIIFAMSVIAYGLYRKADDADFKFFSLSGEKTNQETPEPISLASPAARPGALPKAFGEVMLSLPAGCVIANVTGDGTRIFLKIGSVGKTCESVIIVDANSGALLGTLKVFP
jgi:hypothetical protein